MLRFMNRVYAITGWEITAAGINDIVMIDTIYGLTAHADHVWWLLEVGSMDLKLNKYHEFFVDIELGRNRQTIAASGNTA